MRTAIACLAATLTTLPASAAVEADQRPDLDSRGTHHFVTLWPDDAKRPEGMIILACMASGDFDAVIGPDADGGEWLHYSLDDGEVKETQSLMLRWDPESTFLHDLAKASTMRARIGDGAEMNYDLDGIYEAVATITRNCDVN